MHVLLNFLEFLLKVRLGRVEIIAQQGRRAANPVASILKTQGNTAVCSPSFDPLLRFQRQVHSRVYFRVLQTKQFILVRDTMKRTSSRSLRIAFSAANMNAPRFKLRRLFNGSFSIEAGQNSTAFAFNAENWRQAMEKMHLGRRTHF